MTSPSGTPDHPLVITVIDHTDPDWHARYMRRGRENGAATYSREIVAHHVPVWEQQLPDGSVVSTCPLLVDAELEAPTVVQYLHTYSYHQPLRQAELVASHLTGRADRVVFVTAYRSLHALLTLAGHEALFVPMTVDTGRVRAAASPEPLHPERRVLYFGNITRPKRALFAQVNQAFESRGWIVDVCSDGWLEGRHLSQRAAWAAASRYRFGIGVGRCALEMMALGLHVLVAGAELGGLATTPDEHAAQWATNYNGRVTTFDRDLRVCVDAIELATACDRDLPAAVDAVRGWAGALVAPLAVPA